MASKTHKLSTNVRLEVNTIGTTLPAFVEWGAEAWRQKRKWFLFVPYWADSGESPQFSVSFTHANGTEVGPPQVNPTNETRTGYRKRAIVSVNQSQATALPTEAVWMTNVTMQYSVNGTPKTLSHHA